MCLFWRDCCYKTSKQFQIKTAISPIYLTMSWIAFESPCSLIVSGPSGSGKSTFIFNLLENVGEMFTKTPIKIYYFYSVWQDLFDKCKIKNLNFIKKIPDENIIEDMTDGSHHLLIIDDLQIAALNDGFIANLFTRESHHRNLSVILILQNSFHQGKYARDISLNAHYFILFKYPRDKNQIKILGNQLGIRDKIEEAYLSAPERPFSYLVIDLSPRSESEYMLRSNILSHDYTLVYK